MRKTHLDMHNSPAGKNYASHMKSIGYVFKPKDKSVRRQAEKKHTGNLRKLALKKKISSKDKIEKNNFNQEEESSREYYHRHGHL